MSGSVARWSKTYQAVLPIHTLLLEAPCEALSSHPDAGDTASAVCQQMYVGNLPRKERACRDLHTWLR